MYRSARPLLGLARPAARTVVFPSASSSSRNTTFRIAAAATPSLSSRGYAVKVQKADVRGAMRANIRLNKNSDSGYRASDMEKAQAEGMKHILLPGTFVPIPLVDHEKNSVAAVRTLLRYIWSRLKQHGKDFAAIASAKWMSMPTFRERPQLQLSWRQIAPTAKALHVQLNQALAAADRDTLRKICTPRLAESLSATVSRRKASEVLTWELIDHGKEPSVVSHKLAMMPPVGKGPFVQQAVVRILSTQKLGKQDARTGESIEGALKVRKLTEYIVLTRQIEPKTYKPGEWLVWGTIAGTTPEDWAEEEKAMTLMEQQDFQKRNAGKQ
ncbi:hypothetical protein CPLU01_09314 [Colletotrichum plurivorum]|uniref:Large ribosomal subunit protein mL45 n=1 Tax=Colletotrichum plurivorum TaxID=2175906 RepID=A0A8H6K965_9PEZI|nr:hypothetical protein CPLU01_09314 [Colletotrichum plurivorum]